MENLDLKCAQLGQNLAVIPGLEEKHLNDALSVLEEQGLYAFFLFLKARVKASGKQDQDKSPGKEIAEKCQTFLTEMNLIPNGMELYRALQALANNLHQLLFARDLLRQALIYARFHLKAKEEAR